MAKVVQFGRGTLNHKALLHQILDSEDVDAVALVVRIDGRWRTCWGGAINSGSLSMAAIKLLHDVSHDNDEGA